MLNKTPLIEETPLPWYVCIVCCFWVRLPPCWQFESQTAENILFLLDLQPAQLVELMIIIIIIIKLGF